MISNAQIFTWIGINPASVRNALIADFLSGGLEGLRSMSSDDIKDTFASYIKRSDPPFPIVLSPPAEATSEGTRLACQGYYSG